MDGGNLGEFDVLLLEEGLDGLYVPWGNDRTFNKKSFKDIGSAF